MARRIPSSSREPEDMADLDNPELVETGALAIANTKEGIQQPELWERPSSVATESLTSNEGTILRFEILLARILSPENGDNKVKRYVSYEITVRQDTKVLDPCPATITRRYTDFRNLYIALKKKHPTEMNAIPFPQKVFVGNFAMELIGERSSAFEKFLTHIASHSLLRDEPDFLNFLQNIELIKACRLLDERRNESAIPLLENSFRLLNKIFMDRSKPVLLILCRLVAACTTCPVPHHSAERWATLALNRYDTLCDIDLLCLYVPLLNTCAHLWWQRGIDQKPIVDRLAAMSRRGINISNDITLTQAIHKLDPRTETI